MKYLSLLTKLSFLFLVIFTVSSCGTDDTIVDNQPLVSLSQADGSLWEDFQDVSNQTEIVVSVTGTSGTAEMETLTILEDGTKIELDRISLASNPKSLFDADRTNYKEDITITLPTTPGDYTYSFEIQDTDGLIGSESVSVTTISGVTNPPTVTTTSGTDLSTDTGSLVALSITATPGDANLNSIAVYEEGILVDSSRLYIDGVPFPSNPTGLLESEYAGFTASISIRSQAEENTTRNYTIEVEDDNGEKGTLALTISTQAVVTGTAISSTHFGILLNQSGPSGTGGLDLDEGFGTGSADGSAEIRDMGSDFNLPPEQNWRQLISAVNGAELRRVGSNVPETFDFATVQFKEEIEGAFADSDPGSEFFVSLGNQFIISGNGKYYLIKCTNIEITPDAGDNGDKYTFDIKW